MILGKHWNVCFDVLHILNNLWHFPTTSVTSSWENPWVAQKALFPVPWDTLLCTSDSASFSMIFCSSVTVLNRSSCIIPGAIGVIFSNGFLGPLQPFKVSQVHFIAQWLQHSWDGTNGTIWRSKLNSLLHDNTQLILKTCGHLHHSEIAAAHNSTPQHLMGSHLFQHGLLAGGSPEGF